MEIEESWRKTNGLLFKEASCSDSWSRIY